MKRYLPLLMLLHCTLILHAQQGTVLDNEKETIKRILTEMWAAIEVGDINGYAGFLHPDFTVFGENSVYLRKGRELEVKSVSQWIKYARDIRTEMHHPEVSVRGEVAWIIYYWTDSGVEEGKRFATEGKSTRIFVKEAGKWLCIHAHHTLV